MRILVITMMLALGGCRCPAPEPLTREVVRERRVYETVRDTVVRVEPDRSSVRALIACDSLGKLRLMQLTQLEAGTHLGTPRVKVQGNVVTVTAEVDSFNVYMSWRQRHEIETHSEVIRGVVEVNRPTPLQTLWMWLGKITALVLIGWIGWRLVEPRLLNWIK